MTTVLTAPATVVATLVVPITVLAGTVETVVLVTDTVLTTNDPPTLVDITCPETMVLETTEAGRVVGRTVVADMVLGGRVVVYVSVTNPPSAVAGIALPTPEAVYCDGRTRVAVFGFAAALLEYIFPVCPFVNV